MNFLQRLLNTTGLTKVVTRAFEIARGGRRLAAIPNTTVALNTLIAQYGRSAIARSRYLVTNNGYAASAKETFVTSLIGFGIKPSTLGETAEVKKRVQEDWLDWCAYADADGLTDFYGQQQLAASELFEAGEVFAVMQDTPTAEGVVPLQVRLVPAEMLPYENSSNAHIDAGNTIQMGIEFDPQGKRVAYHFLKNHPGDVTKLSSDWQAQRITADRVIHLFRPVRAGQVRGIPHTLAALTTLAMLDLYDDAELERKRVAALFAAFVTKPSPNAPDPMGTTVPTTLATATLPAEQSFPMRPGAIVDLLPGEGVSFAEPADVGGSYESFQYRNLLRAAAGFGVPYTSLTGDLRNGNYGSIRAGLVEFRRRIEAMQYSVIIQLYCRPIWLRWLANYTRTGLSPWSAADYISNLRLHQRVKWLPPRWDWVDPLKDLQAEKLAVDNGFKARHDVIEEQGYDPEETDQRIEDSQDSAEAHNLELNTGAVPPASEADPANPADPAEPGDGNPPTRTKEKPDVA